MNNMLVFFVALFTGFTILFVVGCVYQILYKKIRGDRKDEKGIKEYFDYK